MLPFSYERVSRYIHIQTFQHVYVLLQFLCWRMVEVRCVINALLPYLLDLYPAIKITREEPACPSCPACPLLTCQCDWSATLWVVIGVVPCRALEKVQFDCITTGSVTAGDFPSATEQVYDTDLERKKNKKGTGNGNETEMDE